MKPIKEEGMNLELQAPKGSEGDVLPLPVLFDRDNHIAISCWELTEDEIRSVMTNGKFYFAVFTHGGHPPILPLAACSLQDAVNQVYV